MPVLDSTNNQALKPRPGYFANLLLQVFDIRYLRWLLLLQMQLGLVVVQLSNEPIVALLTKGHDCFQPVGLVLKYESLIVVPHLVSPEHPTQSFHGVHKGNLLAVFESNMAGTFSFHD